MINIVFYFVFATFIGCVSFGQTIEMYGLSGTEARLIKEAGVNATLILYDDDSTTREIQITKIVELPNGFIDAESKYTERDLDLSRNKIQVKYDQNRDEIVAEMNPNFSAGVTGGLASALQHGIISDSRTARRIQAGYARIRNIYIGIQFSKKEMTSVRIKLQETAEATAHVAENFSKRPSVALPVAASALAMMPMSAFSDRELRNYKLASSDPQFRERAESLREVLLKTPARSKSELGLKNISKLSLLFGDRSSAAGDQEQAKFLLGIGEKAADILVGIDPITGAGRSIYELLSGENLITGIPLSTGERIMAGLGVVTLGYVSNAWKAYKYLVPLAKKIAPELSAGYRAFGNFLQKLGQDSRIVSGSKVIRKIDMRADMKTGHGLTATHLNKHFFGTGKRALKNIDPAGSLDVWLENISTLAQKRPTRILPNGMIEITHSFPKTDGSGTYKMGLLLQEKEDSWFKLVTVLTEQ